MVHDEEKQSVVDIERGQKGEAVLREIEDALGDGDFGDALKAGEVVTVNNLNDIIKCETGAPAHIDENNITEDGAELIEGDMLKPQDESSASSLLEAIKQGSRWAGELWPKGEVAYCFKPGTHDDAVEAFE